MTTRHALAALLLVTGGCFTGSGDEPPTLPERPLDAGRVGLKRLTNVEYDNTVRDLLFTDLRPSVNFPPDELAHGWDHMADAQTVSPLHMELYLQAANQLVTTELPAPGATSRRFEAEQDLDGVGYVRDETRVLNVSGAAETVVEVPLAATYTVRARLAAQQGGDALARAAIQVDGTTIREFDVPGEGEFTVVEVEVELDAQAHTLGVAFLNDYYVADVADRDLIVDWIELAGGAATRAQARYYTCEPSGPEDRACASEVVEGFATAAWRRPLDAEGRAFIDGLLQSARERGATWSETVRTGFVGALVSPRFLFRPELDPEPTSPESRPLDGYELASRLSYFLWRTMPDERLIDLAASGTLGEDATLRAEVDRMLDDPRSETFVTEFAGQWLAIRAIADVEPDYERFPDFDDALREAMQREMELFAADILLSPDRSVLELLSADMTFVNPRLAAHYGMPDPGVDAFVPARVEDPPRTGLLGKSGLLTALSFPRRTSPVKRGQWVMSNLLCEAPPPAPAAVEGLDEEAVEGRTLREKMERHREDPACATCHRVMDPIGFSMENFDAVGAWRQTDDDGYPIDASGTWPGGPVFDDSRELSLALAADPRVPRCIVQTTFAYALGRPAGIEDRRYLEAIEDEFAAADHHFDELITAIVLSPPFRTRRGEIEETP